MEKRTPEASSVERGNAVARLLHRLFAKQTHKSPFSIEPADTDYEYAFPFSHYSGPVDPAGPVVEVRRKLREEGLGGFTHDG